MTRYSEEFSDWIRENLSYNPWTGNLYWTKQREGRGKLRDLTKPVGTTNGAGYLVVGIRLNRRQILMECHIIGWFLHYGNWPELNLDHKDGDRSNNRIDNLRLSSHTRNSQNKFKTTKKTTSRFKGVHRERSTGKWVARIYFGGKRIELGRFLEEDDAAKAYDKAAVEYFGEFAKVNFG